MAYMSTLALRTNCCCIGSYNPFGQSTALEVMRSSCACMLLIQPLRCISGGERTCERRVGVQPSAEHCCCRRLGAGEEP